MLCRPSGGGLQIIEPCLLSLVRLYCLFDLRARPLGRGIRGGAILRQRTARSRIRLRGRLISGVELRFLLVRQGAVEGLERPAYHIDCLYHRLDPLLHGSEPPGRRECHRGRASGLDDLRCLHRRIGKIVERHALLIIRRHELPDAIDRPAGYLLGVIPAHLRDLAR